MTRSLVDYQVRGAVRVLAIDRSERRNAVDRATAAALLDAYRRFEADPEARVLVLTGRGGTFSAGADLQAMDNDVFAPEGPMGFTRLTPSKPAIAAVEGWCVAGGLELALFCDLRVAGASARFGCLERRWGVPLIDGGTQRLPRVVGLGRALDLVLTGRAIDAREAERIGLVDRVVEDGEALEAALGLAAEIAEHPWACVLADRASLFDGLGQPVADGLRLEGERGAQVLAAALEGAARFTSGAGRHGGRR
ncbi:MAG: crotonase/enoyl-CoA hydratase family protein [Sorangiineae bacterium]|nr:crotonase/enoyl-CoA hydratase family protein [Polyangiaceae bacterium]MEB2322405.1 crotonase/enoyl-CoA hydratase family protein [Sorangiineae bacterium]